MPDVPRAARAACASRLQPLKSPMTRHALGVRRPDGEVRAAAAVDRRRVRAELVVQAQVAALVEEVQVVVGEQASTSWHARIARSPSSPPSRVIAASSRSRMPRSGMRTQSGRLFELVAELVDAFSSSRTPSSSVASSSRASRQRSPASPALSQVGRAGTRRSTQRVPEARPRARARRVLARRDAARAPARERRVRRVVERAQHAGHVAQRRALEAPLGRASAPARPRSR